MLKIVKTGAGFPADMYLFKINNGNTSINLFKINNEDTRTHSLASFWCLYC